MAELLCPVVEFEKPGILACGKGTITGSTLRVSMLSEYLLWRPATGFKGGGGL